MVARRIRRPLLHGALGVASLVVAPLAALGAQQLTFGTPQLSAYVFPNGFTQAGTAPGQNVNPLTVNTSSTATSAHADMSGGSQILSGIFGNSQQFVGVAAAQGVADATFGGLHLAALGTTQVSPRCYGCGGSFPGVLGNNPYYTSLQAGIGVGLTDWFQLTSSTLPVGAPVTFDWGYDFHRIVNAPIGRAPWSSSYWALTAQLDGPGGTVPFAGSIGSYNPLFNNSGWLYYQPSTVTVLPIAAHIGDVFHMSLGFAVDFTMSDSYANPASYNTESIDASNTLSVVMGNATPGVTFLTASGFDYQTGQYVAPDPNVPPTTTTPEPETLALLAIGLLGTMVFARRRKA